LLPRPPPLSTLFPYTTLFRSDSVRVTLPQFLDDQCVHVVGRARTHEAAILMGAEAKRAPVTNAGPSNQVRPPRIRSAGRRNALPDRKSTRLNSSHVKISYAVF